jgi:hypothetical protein
MGRFPSADHDALLKTATIIIKLQAAAISAERASLELPKLRGKALLEHLDHAMTIVDSQEDQHDHDALEEAEELRQIKRKSRPKTSSSSIKANKGSSKKPASPPKPTQPTEPTLIENVNFIPPKSTSEPIESTLTAATTAPPAQPNEKTPPLFPKSGVA